MIQLWLPWPPTLKRGQCNPPPKMKMCTRQSNDSSSNGWVTSVENYVPAAAAMIKFPLTSGSTCSLKLPAYALRSSICVRRFSGRLTHMWKPFHRASLTCSTPSPSPSVTNSPSMCTPYCAMLIGLTIGKSVPVVHHSVPGHLPVQAWVLIRMQLPPICN